VNVPQSVPEKKTRKWMHVSLAVLLAVVALQIYYVQEMIAAFVIFCVLFALGAAVGLLLFVLDFASERAVAWADPPVVRIVRRGWTVLKELSRRLLHRPRSETAQ